MKQDIREAVWLKMTEAKVGGFPFPLKGRIPNFRGAAQAAERLFETDQWRRAKVVKANPDAPQRPVRKRALEEGKTLYMAVPRLRERDCFLEVAVPPDRAAEAASIKGAFVHGRPIHPSRMARIDLVVAGSVAVNGLGERIGKGGGFSDLELAIGGAYGLVDEGTAFVTTVHDLQVSDEPLPQAVHDAVLDLVATPTRVVACQPQRRRPQGVFWDLLPAEKEAAIPVMADLRGLRNQ